MLKAYTPIFQTIRAPVAEARSLNTPRSTQPLVCPRCVHRAAHCLFRGPVDIFGLFHNIGGINRRLPDVPVPSVGQVSWTFHRQIIQVLDGDFPLCPSVVLGLIGIHRSSFPRPGNNTNITRTCTRNTGTSCALVSHPHLHAGS